MAKIANLSKENPRLEQRLLKDGRIALDLVYYLGRAEKPVLDEFGEPVLYESGAMKGKPKYKVVHRRKKESLPFYLIAKPRTPIERQQNKEVLAMAQKVRFEREQDMIASESGLRLRMNKSVNFHDYCLTYIYNYTKKDLRMIKMAYSNFVAFIKATPEYAGFTDRLKPEQITPDMIRDFVEYLQATHKGEGASSAYSRFKKIVKYAVDHSVITHNPCNGIAIKIDKNRLVKDILSEDEIRQLVATRDERQNQEVRRAFILSLYCGIRWCDVKDLTYANVDFSNRLLTFEQSKTKGSSSNSTVVIPLNDGLLKLIGRPANESDKEQLIFNLPSHSMCLKSLGRWVKKAGINKHITWHCGRHSFAVNILSKGANIKTVASLLGHSDLSQTEKYTRAIDSLKEAAINSLPALEF